MTEREWAVAELDALSDPDAIEFTVGQGEWPFRGFIVRSGGQIYAYANVCPHQKHPLNLEPRGFFTRDRDALLCSSHGAIFDLHTGECIAGPCSGRSLRKLGCRLEGNTICVVAPDSLRSELE